VVTLRELLPSNEQVSRLKDTEAALLRRRTIGTASGVVALASAVVQVVLGLSQGDYLAKLGGLVRALVTVDLQTLSALRPQAEQVWGLAAIVLGAGGWLALRWTGVLLRESREPFRYTFTIRPFTWVEKTPGTRCVLLERDRFELLHHDLTDRLNQRIRRFRVLDEPGSNAGASPNGEGQTTSAERSASAPQGVAAVRRSSHIHITGHIALREERNGRCVLQITPVIRIGPPGAPGHPGHGRLLSAHRPRTAHRRRALTRRQGRRGIRT
jgi:hypothetical protein